MKFFITLIVATFCIIAVAVLLPSKSSKQTEASPDELTESLGASFENSEDKISLKDKPLPKIILSDDQVQTFSDSSSVSSAKVDSRVAYRKARFQEQYDEVQNKIDELTKQRIQLESESVTITPEFEQAVSRIHELEAQKFDYQNEIGKCNLQLAEIEKEYNSYHDERDYVGRKAKSGTYYDNDKKKWFRWKKVRNMSWMDYQNAKSKIDSNIRLATIKIKKIDEEINALKVKIGAANTDIEGIKIANQNIQIQIEKINKQIEELKIEQKRIQEIIDSIY